MSVENTNTHVDHASSEAAVGKLNRGQMVGRSMLPKWIGVQSAASVDGDDVAGRQRAARDDLAIQPAAVQHEVDEVEAKDGGQRLAGLAEPNAEEFDLAYVEGLADQVVQLDAFGQQVPPAVLAGHDDAVLVVQPVELLLFDQGHLAVGMIAWFGVAAVALGVAVSSESVVGQGLNGVMPDHLGSGGWCSPDFNERASGHAVAPS